MRFMFYECNSLANIDLSNFNTQKVTDMSHMFYECSSLKDLNLSHFNTQNVTDMTGMFWYCTSLESIDLSNAENISNLKKIIPNKVKIKYWKK